MSPSQFEKLMELLNKILEEIRLIREAIEKGGK